MSARAATNRSTSQQQILAINRHQRRPLLPRPLQLHADEPPSKKSSAPAALSSIGCTTCLTRSIVCDRNIPQCHRCLNRGLLCDNYVYVEAWKVEVLSQNNEKRALQFFRENTAPRLSGHYDKRFWRDVVLRVSFSDPALRHLLAGIGALHESLDLKSRTIPLEESARYQYRFSLQQCSKSLKMLSSSDGVPPSTAIILMSCVLFITYEACQNGVETAIQHLASGLKLVNTWKDSKASLRITPSEDDLVNAHLYPLISRLGNQFNVTSKQYGELDKAVRPRLKWTALATASQKLENLEQAGEVLETILHEIIAMVESPKKPSDESLARIVLQYTETLKDWHSSFMLFVRRSSDKKDSSFPLEAISLQLRFYTATIVLGTFPFANEMLFDHYNEHFRNIILLCREFFQLEHGQGTAQEGKLNLGFDNEIIMPLWMTGCCCRDPYIRRDAIDLMYEIKRQEVVWGSEICAVFAQQVMMIEEEGLIVRKAEDIPHERRIRLLTVDHEPAAFASSPSSTQFDLQHPCFIFEWYRPAEMRFGKSAPVRQTRLYFKGFIPLSDPQSRSPSVSGLDKSFTSKNDEMIALHVHDAGDFAWRISFPYDFDHCLMMQWAVAHFNVS